MTCTYLLPGTKLLARATWYLLEPGTIERLLRYDMRVMLRAIIHDLQGLGRGARRDDPLYMVTTIMMRTWYFIVATYNTQLRTTTAAAAAVCCMPRLIIRAT